MSATVGNVGFRRAGVYSPAESVSSDRKRELSRWYRKTIANWDALQASLNDRPPNRDELKELSHLWMQTYPAGFPLRLRELSPKRAQALEEAHARIDWWVGELCSAAFPDSQDTSKARDLFICGDDVLISKVARNLWRHYGTSTESARAPHPKPTDIRIEDGIESSWSYDPADPRRFLLCGVSVYTGGPESRPAKLLKLLSSPLGTERTLSEVFEALEGYDLGLLHDSDSYDKALKRLRRTVSDLRKSLQKNGREDTFALSNIRPPGDVESSYVLMVKK